MELAMHRIIKGLDSEAMRHSVVCLKGDSSIQDRFGHKVQIFCMHAENRALTLPFRLWQLLRHLRPTIIHARNWSAWPDVALARLWLGRSIPLIFSFHGFDRVGSVPLRRRVLSWGLAKITDHMFTVSEAARQFMVDHLWLPAQRIGIISNGVDTDRFMPRLANKTNGSQLVVGTVGNLTPVKNQTFLIEACAILIGRGMELEVRVAGEGSERKNLTNLARTLGIQKNVHLLGHIDDIPEFLRQLDIFVLPSASEAHPNALLEAMASGLPCIATRVGGNEEVLDGGGVGYLVKNGNTGDLADAMARLGQDAGLRQNIGHAARDWVCRKYSLKRMIEAYDVMYRSVSNAYFMR